MRIRKLVSRAKKYARARKAARTRLAIGAAGILLVLTTIVAASRLGASPAAHDASAAAQAAPVPVSQRMIDNEKARLDVEAPMASASPASAVAQTAPVTVVGCLEQHDEGFRLTDTSGAAAPTARSWKSGFLKKRAASVEVIDSANRLKLKDHVGRRVSVTGVLVDREMRARSVKNAGACS